MLGFDVSLTHLDACDQLLYALFWRHIHHSRHVTLPSEVTLQAPQGLAGRLLIDISDHNRGALRGKPLTHSATNPTATSWVRKERIEAQKAGNMTCGQTLAKCSDDSYPELSCINLMEKSVDKTKLKLPADWSCDISPPSTRFCFDVPKSARTLCVYSAPALLVYLPAN